MAVRYVTVNELTGTVVNVGQEASAGLISDPPSLHRNIVESDWVPGSDPQIGDAWDGQIPTTFTRPEGQTDVTQMTGNELVMAIQGATDMTQRATAEQARRLAVGGISE